MAFIATVTKIIVRFKDPLKECVDIVGRVLSDVIDKSAEHVSHYTYRDRQFCRNAMKAFVSGKKVT